MKQKKKLTGSGPLQSNNENEKSKDLSSGSETINQNSEIEPMEVHHHGHVHHQKKWKEYLYQFFMLFLAVFFGFLAEYQLEHVIENQREKKYIKSLIEDLKTDTAKINSNLKRFDILSAQRDTIMQLFPALVNGFNSTLYRNFPAMKGYPDFIYTDGTIQQLKNSGGLRLIRKLEITDSIMAYDARVKAALINEQYLGRLLEGLYHTEASFFNYQDLDIQLKAGKTLEGLETEKFDFILSRDKAALARFYNEMRNYAFVCQIVKRDMDLVRSKATSLIQFLKKEYDFDDEDLLH